MKGFYRLLNYEFSTMKRALLILYLGVMVTPLVFLNIAMKDFGNIYNRFEKIYSSSGCIAVFLVYFAALCALFLKSIYANYWGSKSIYTLLSLPVKREAVYFSKPVAFFIAFLGFWAAQLTGVLLGYILVASKVAAIENGKYLMNNGLFLAFLRSGFLRLLLPFSLEDMISSVSIFATAILALYYGALCERSGRYWGVVPVAATVLLIIYILSYRMGNPAFQTTYKNLYIYSVLLFGFDAFFTGHGMRLVKNGAVA